MKLGANPESDFNAVANAEPGLTPLSKFWITLLTSFQLERGVAPNFFG